MASYEKGRGRSVGRLTHPDCQESHFDEWLRVGILQGYQFTKHPRHDLRWQRCPANTGVSRWDRSLSSVQCQGCHQAGWRHLSLHFVYPMSEWCSTQCQRTGWRLGKSRQTFLKSFTNSTGRTLHTITGAQHPEPAMVRYGHYFIFFCFSRNRRFP